MSRFFKCTSRTQLISYVLFAVSLAALAFALFVYFMTEEKVVEADKESRDRPSLVREEKETNQSQVEEQRPAEFSSNLSSTNTTSPEPAIQRDSSQEPKSVAQPKEMEDKQETQPASGRSFVDQLTSPITNLIGG